LLRSSSIGTIEKVDLMRDETSRRRSGWVVDGSQDGSSLACGTRLPAKNP